MSKIESLTLEEGPSHCVRQGPSHSVRQGLSLTVEKLSPYVERPLANARGRPLTVFEASLIYCFLTV